jgi:isochorismate synthase EntC
MNKNTTWNRFLKEAIQKHPSKSLKKIILDTKKNLRKSQKANKKKTLKLKKNNYKLEYKF